MFNNIFAKDHDAVNLGMIQKFIDAKKLDAGATIDQAALRAAGLSRGGKDGVRILAKGELTAKISISVAGASKSAVEAIEKAGGKVEILVVKAASEKAAAKKGVTKKANDAAKAAKNAK